MKEIPLSQGKVALCDDADYELLMQFKWYYHKHGYACSNRGYDKVAMHRMLVEKEHGSRGIRVFAIDGNHCNCQRSNLLVKETIVKKYGPYFNGVKLC